MDERYCLSDQMRRAAISISSNIAEGFSRRTKADKTHFYVQALGSLTELQNQLLVMRDVGYFDKDYFLSISSQTIIVSKLINSLIKYLNNT